LARKILEISQRLEVSAAHLLSKLYQRVVRFLVVSSVLPPFRVRGDEGEARLRPEEISFSLTTKSAPSLIELNPSAIAKFLAGLLEMELNVEVKYKSPFRQGIESNAS
jgi:hypothetical protein